MICTIAGYGREDHARGLCEKHYQRLKKHGDPNYVFEKKICSIPGCGRPVSGYGWCRFHYQHWLRNGDPEATRRTYEIHGLRNTPEYNIWHAMNDRCASPKNKFYHRYGGRGISVCERWRHSFKAFFSDIGPRPFPDAQLDRINNDGNYEPGNCRWVTRKENCMNRIDYRSGRMYGDRVDRAAAGQ